MFVLTQSVAQRVRPGGGANDDWDDHGEGRGIFEPGWRRCNIMVQRIWPAGGENVDGDDHMEGQGKFWARLADVQWRTEGLARMRGKCRWGRPWIWEKAGKAQVQ